MSSAKLMTEKMQTPRYLKRFVIDINLEDFDDDLVEIVIRKLRAIGNNWSRDMANIIKRT